MRFRKLAPFTLAGVLAFTTAVYAQSAFEQGLDAYLKGDYAKALELWEPVAESGDAVAAFNIGVLYAQGLGVEANADEALRWYRQSALAGYSNAQFNLGVVYYNGEGTDKNIGQAISWWEKAAEQDHPEALYNLATLYRRGEGTKQDIGRAVALFEKAAILGDSRAQQALENLRLSAAAAESQAEAVEQAGTEESQTSIARENPEHWTVQVFASVERQAAERFARKHGLSDELRIYKANSDGKTWFKGIYGSYPDRGAVRAAKTELEKRLPGSSPWIRRFGAVQAEAIEEVVTGSSPKAKQPVEMAAGDDQPERPLEEIGDTGREQAAAEDINKESEPGTPAPTETSEPAPEPKEEKTTAVTPSKRDTALFRGQKAFNAQNYKEAFEAWRPLAETGVSEAQYGIGFMYESGWGAPKNYEEAFRWYQLAAQQGHVKAQFNLGMLYRNGQGVSQNDALGLYWIQTAADRGDERALNYLKSLN